MSSVRRQTFGGVVSVSAVGGNIKWDIVEYRNPLFALLVVNKATSLKHVAKVLAVAPVRTMIVTMALQYNRSSSLLKKKKERKSVRCITCQKKPKKKILQVLPRLTMTS